MSAITYPHIELDAQGEPVITGTGTKVVMVALDRIAHHWDAQEIQRQRPHLTLGQIHSALAYYYDNEPEINALIDDRLHLEEQLLGQFSESRIRATLRAAKRSG